MPDNRGRIQLTFRLDKPLEQAAYETIQSLPRKNKTEFIANCISECQRSDGMAEHIAKKLYEILSENKFPVAAPAKRKRGRPRKQAPAYGITGIHEKEALIQQQKTENEGGNSDYAESQIPSVISPLMPSEIKPELQTGSNEIQSDSDGIQPMLNEDKASESDSETEDSILDEDMLRSMECFVNL